MTLIFLTCIKIFLAIVLYPIYFIYSLIHDILSRKDERAIFFKMFLRSCALTLWLIVFSYIFNRVNTMGVSGALTLVADMMADGSLKYDASIDNSNGLLQGGNGYGNIDVNGEIYNIDLSNLPSDVKLPAGSYANGSILQRCEILLILQEICSRPEITVSVEQMCGMFYSECTGSISCSGSVVKTCWPQVNNQYDCGGPFQIMTSEMINSGCAYISKIEDPNLSDNERVLSYSEAKSLPQVDGLSRPSKFFFSDAAYTCARLLSWHYPANDKYNARHWTNDASKYAKSNGLDSYGVDILEFNSATYYYNSYTPSAKSWLPAFYGDLVLLKGDMGQWSHLATSRPTLNDKLRSELILETKRTLPNMTNDEMTYYESYSDCLANGNWENTQFPFVTYNGGRWIYNGLKTLAEQVGNKNTDILGNPVYGTDTNGAMSKEAFEYLYSIAKKYYGRPYLLDNSPGNDMHPPDNFCCASYVSYVFTEAGYSGVTSWSAQGLHDNSVNFITKEQLCPGDLIFFGGTYDNAPNPITHVAIYIGNGKVAEAGSPVGEGSLKGYETGKAKGWIDSYGRVKSLK